MLFVRMLAHPAMPPPPQPGEKPVSTDEWYRQSLDRHVSVTREQMNHVEQMLQSIRFATDHSGPVTTDGSDWLFEIEQTGHYQVVDFRNTLPQEAKQLGLYLVVDLGGVKLQPGEIY